MDLLREQVGSEQSTNFRWWDFGDSTSLFKPVVSAFSNGPVALIKF